GVDGDAWRGLLGPLAHGWRDVVAVALGDKRSVPGRVLRPEGAAVAARFGAAVLEQGTAAWGRRFETEEAGALLTGVAAHAISRLPSLAAAGTAVLLASLGHAPGGWPLPRGGSGAIVGALVDDLRAHGGDVVTGHRV